MIAGIDHINLVVSNMERALAFYTGLLGFVETRRARLEGAWIEAIVGLRGVSAEVAYIEPPEGGIRLELLQYHAPEGRRLPGCSAPNTVGLRHIAFRVKNLDQLYERLRAAGVPFVGPPVAVPGAVIRHAAGDKRLCYFHDPDGVLLELAEYQ